MTTINRSAVMTRATQLRTTFNMTQGEAQSQAWAEAKGATPMVKATHSKVVAQDIVGTGHPDSTCLTNPVITMDSIKAANVDKDVYWAGLGHNKTLADTLAQCEHSVLRASRQEVITSSMDDEGWFKDFASGLVGVVYMGGGSAPTPNITCDVTEKSVFQHEQVSHYDEVQAELDAIDNIEGFHAVDSIYTMETEESAEDLIKAYNLKNNRDRQDIGMSDDDYQMTLHGGVYKDAADYL